MLYRFLKVKSQKYRTSTKIQKGKSLIKWQNQKLKHIKRIDNSSYIHICFVDSLLYSFMHRRF